jgi:hypothetical protein
MPFAWLSQNRYPQASLGSHSGILMPPICWRLASTSALSRSISVTTPPKPPRSTLT